MNKAINKTISGIMIASTISLTAVATQAQDYRAEIDLALGKVEIADQDVNLYGVQGIYHFSDVDTENKPLAEAAFLNKSSNLSVAYLETDVLNLNTSIINLGGEFYIPNTFLYLSADYTKVEIDSQNEEGYAFSIGITPIDGLLLKTEYIKDEDYNANIDAKYVVGLGGNQSLNLEAGFVNGDDENSFNVGMDYYFTHATSVGLAYAETGSDSEQTIRAKHFLTQNAFIGASYTDADLEKAYLFEAGIRF